MLIFKLSKVCFGSLRYHWNWLGKELLYSEFHAISHTPSCNFTQFSRNFTQFWLFSHFLAYFNMLGIKMRVLEKRNSIVILSHIFMYSLAQFSCNFNYFGHFFSRLRSRPNFWPGSSKNLKSSSTHAPAQEDMRDLQTFWEVCNRYLG